MRRCQGLVDCVKNELMQCARIAESHLGFGGMHVHIHALRTHFQEQHKSRMPFQMQHVAVSFAQRMGDQFVADETAVDEEILGIAGGARVGGQCCRTPQAQICCLFINECRSLDKFLAQYCRDALFCIRRTQVMTYFSVVLQREADGGT